MRSKVFGRKHDQIIDNVNVDSIVFSGYDSDQKENAEKTIQSFREFINENKDELLHLE